MITIGIVSEKGGSGKSTTAIHLAVALARRQQSVLLVDSDKAPGSAVRMWSASRNETDIDVIGLDRPTLDKDLKKLGRQDDVQIIDGVANDPLMAVAAIKAADLVLIPVQATPNDLWALSGLVDLVRQRQALTDGALRAAFVLTRAAPRTRLLREATAVLGDLGVPLLSTVVHQRVAYPTALSEGKTVFDDIKSIDRPSLLAARAEIDALADECLALLAQPLACAA